MTGAGGGAGPTRAGTGPVAGAAGAAGAGARATAAAAGGVAGAAARVTEPPDAALVARVLAGERSAFDPLVRRHQGALFRHARAMGMDADSAADVVQDALVRAYERLDTCRDPERFGVWAGTIVRNRCLDVLKSAASRSEPLPVRLPAPGAGPERAQERKELRAQLNEALSALPDEQREAFLMKHGEDRSYDEMAALTGASVSAMKMRVHRARDALQVSLRARSAGL